MAEEEAKKVEVEVTKDKEPEAAPAPTEAEPEAAKEVVAEEKAVIPAAEPPAAEEKPPAPADDTKALAIVESEYTLLCLILPLYVLEGLRMERWCWLVCALNSCARNFEKLSYSDLSMLWFVVSVLSGSCTVRVLGTCHP